jgi:hypothetical protein
MNINKHNVHEKRMIAEIYQLFMIKASFTALQGESVKMTGYNKTNNFFY